MQQSKSRKCSGALGTVALWFTLVAVSMAGACTGYLEGGEVLTTDEELSQIEQLMATQRATSPYCPDYRRLCLRAEDLCRDSRRHAVLCSEMLSRCTDTIAQHCDSVAGADGAPAIPDTGAPAIPDAGGPMTADAGTVPIWRDAGADRGSPPPPDTRPIPTDAGAAAVDASPPPADSAPQMPSEWPNGDNTGWRPTGVTLSASGPLTIRTDGTTVDGKDISGGIVIDANHVTIRRSRVRSSSWYPVRVVSGTGIVIEDTEVDGLGGPADGGQKCILIEDGNVVVQRNNLHDCEDGLSLNGSGGLIVRDNFVHTPRGPASAHSDGMELYGGSHMLIQHNRFEYFHATTAATNFTNEWGSISDITYDHNWIAGGAYILYLDGSHGGGLISDIRVTNNHFVRDSSAYGLYVARGTLAAITWVGNVYDDTAEPIAYAGPGGL